MDKSTVIEFIHNEDSEKPKTDERRIIEIYVSYTKGKGYSLRVQPIIRSVNSGIVLREVIPTDGMQRLIQASARFSQKTLLSLAENLDKILYLEMLEQMGINIENYKTLDK